MAMLLNVIKKRQPEISCQFFCGKTMTLDLWGSLGTPFEVPGAASGCLWGSLGRPWGAAWGPWVTLGGPLGPLWAPKGRPPHMGKKRNRHTKKAHTPFGARLDPKWFPRVPKRSPEVFLFRPKMCIGIRTLSGYAFSLKKL